MLMLISDFFFSNRNFFSQEAVLFQGAIQELENVMKIVLGRTRERRTSSSRDNNTIPVW